MKRIQSEKLHASFGSRMLLLVILCACSSEPGMSNPLVDSGPQGGTLGSESLHFTADVSTNGVSESAFVGGTGNGYDALNHDDRCTDVRSDSR